MDKVDGEEEDHVEETEAKAEKGDEAKMLVQVQDRLLSTPMVSSTPILTTHLTRPHRRSQTHGDPHPHVAAAVKIDSASSPEAREENEGGDEDSDDDGKDTVRLAHFDNDGKDTVRLDGFRKRLVGPEYVTGCLRYR